MAKGGSAKTQITDYRMSQHWGIGHQVDRLTAIYVGEKVAWQGFQDVEAAIPINNPELFGGIKKEGGVVGEAYYLPGGPDQVLPEYLAAKLDRTSATAPGYRGVSSVWFSGGPSGGGFLWSSNNPYLKDIWFQVLAGQAGLASLHSRLPDGTGNPVHIIFECMTNTDWGMSGARTSFNIPVWTAAAATVFAEGFGLSLVWTNQTTIEAFVGEIIDHIQATVYINPRDGLWTIKLIRPDYDIDDLPVLDRDNCEITNFERKAWGETVNEVVVTWTNPANEQEETVTAQDLANIMIQGGIVSDSRNYYGIRNAALALQVAQRDLALASAPIALFEIEASRDAWDFVPGGVFVLNYDEDDYEINGLVLRIAKVDYGKKGDPTVKLSCSEDIFALPVGAYGDTEPTQWEDVSEAPRAIDFSRVMTAPLYFVTEALSAASMTGFDYPQVMTIVLAAQDSRDTSSFELVSEVVLPNGDIDTQSFGTMTLVGHSISTTALAAEAQSTVPAFPNFDGPLLPRVNRFVFIGDVAEDQHEIALISDVGYTLDRGVLDTVPRAWPSGTAMWLLDVNSDIIEETPRSNGEVVTYKILPRTSQGILAIDDALPLTATLTGRPWYPNRPGNVKVRTTGFGTVSLNGITSVPVTWANRNRTLEPTQVVKWTDGTVTPEDGQTTTITVMRMDRTVIMTYAGLSGTSYSFPVADLAGATTGIIRVSSERDGLESLQGHEIKFTTAP